MHVATLDYDDYLGYVAIGRIDSRADQDGRPRAAARTATASARSSASQKLLGSQGLKRFEMAEARRRRHLRRHRHGRAQRRRDHHRRSRARSILPLLDDRRADHLDAVHRQQRPVRRAGGQVRHLAQPARPPVQGAEVERRAARRGHRRRPTPSRCSGRGELHLSVLIETMRREGYELWCRSRRSSSRPARTARSSSRTRRSSIDVDEAYSGAVIEELGARGGRMKEMAPAGEGRMRLEYLCPSRGLIGYRSQFLTDTRGTGILNHNFKNYGPYAGHDQGRAPNGVLIAQDARRDQHLRPLLPAGARAAVPRAAGSRSTAARSSACTRATTTWSSTRRRRRS